MADVAQCEELTTSGGNPLSCAKAWGEGCRCGACLQWKTHGEEPADDSDASPPSEYDPGDKERDSGGRFQSTALTRSLRTAIEKVGGQEALYEMVEGGFSAREILEELGIDRKDTTAQTAIYRELNKEPDRYKRAKQASVDALAEKAFRLYGEDTPETSADAKWRDNRAGHLRWLAEMRAGTGRGGVNINVDLGQLHLSALRAKGSMDAMRERKPVEAEYEIEEEG